MKLKHWVGVAAVAIGVLYFWHVMVTHGGWAGFKTGLGFR